VRAAERRLGRDRGGGDEEDLARALMAGFPGRVARRRAAGDARCVLAGGMGALAPPGAGEWFLAVVITAGRRGVRQEHRVRAAMDIELAWLTVEEVQETAWDTAAQAVRGVVRTQVGAIVLDERTAPADPARATALLLEAAQEDPERALAPGREVAELQARILCLRGWRPDLDLPDPDWAALLPRLCEGLRSFKALRGADLKGALLGLLDWSQRQALDELAPASLTLPSGSSRRLRYVPGDAPVLSARIQQCFGWRISPRVAGNRVPVVIELLAPSQRPVQLTADLESFWTHTWPQVRKELRGRYPKHPWPEDPWTAVATDRAKPRKR
jgi:ATP-dependent helicase HrpB